MNIVLISWLVGVVSLAFGYFIGHAFGYNSGWDAGYDKRIHEEKIGKEKLHGHHTRTA